MFDAILIKIKSGSKHFRLKFAFEGSPQSSHIVEKWSMPQTFPPKQCTWCKLRRMHTKQIRYKVKDELTSCTAKISLWKSYCNTRGSTAQLLQYSEISAKPYPSHIFFAIHPSSISFYQACRRSFKIIMPSCFINSVETSWSSQTCPQYFAPYR